MYTSNIIAHPKMKQILTEIKREIDSTTLVADFNILGLPTHGNKKKINKETEDLKNTTVQVYLTDMYRTLHPTTAAENTSFSNMRKTFSRTDHISHKTNLNK